MLYDDTDSLKAVRERRRTLRTGYVAMMMFAIMSFFLFVPLLLVEGVPLEARLSWAVFSIVVLLISSLATYFGAILRAKNELRHGITLTSQTLRLFKEEMAVSAILRAMTLWLGTAGTFLAIDIRIDKGGQKKSATRLVYEKNTENVYVLRDRLRELKGWPKQEDTPMYTLRRWKRGRDQLFQQEVRRFNC